MEQPLPGLVPDQAGEPGRIDDVGEPERPGHPFAGDPQRGLATEQAPGCIGVASGADTLECGECSPEFEFGGGGVPGLASGQAEESAGVGALVGEPHLPPGAPGPVQLVDCAFWVPLHQRNGSPRRGCGGVKRRSIDLLADRCQFGGDGLRRRHVTADVGDLQLGREQTRPADDITLGSVRVLVPALEACCDGGGGPVGVSAGELDEGESRLGPASVFVGFGEGGGGHLDITSPVADVADLGVGEADRVEQPELFELLACSGRLPLCSGVVTR